MLDICPSGLCGHELQDYEARGVKKQKSQILLKLPRSNILRLLYNQYNPRVTLCFGFTHELDIDIILNNSLPLSPLFSCIATLSLLWKWIASALF